MEDLSLEDLKSQIESDFNKYLANYLDSNLRVLSSEHYEKPKPIIEIFDKDSNTWGVVATLGNISTIKGKAKSRKSTLLSLITAATIKGELLDETIKSVLPDDKKNVLYIDTEQQIHHVSFQLHRIKTLSEVSNVDDRLYMYCLRSLSPKERLIKVNEFIQSIPSLGIVIIDGIRDLVMSINDEVESTEIVTLLMKWSLEYNVHIINVLHENPTSDKARGHIGTEMMNKSETVIKVEVDSKEDEISGVYPDMCRNKSFTAFPIAINDDGIPYIPNEPLNNKKGKRIMIKDLNDSQKLKLLSDAFKGVKELSRADLMLNLENSFRSIYANSIGQNQIVKFIQECKDTGLVNQPKGNRKPYVQTTLDF